MSSIPYDVLDPSFSLDIYRAGDITSYVTLRVIMSRYSHNR